MSCSRCAVSFCCCFTIFVAGIIALIVWSAISGYRLPACSVEDFYVPYLNVTDNSTSVRTNHTLYFDLRLKNREPLVGVSYDDVKVTFFYGQNSSLSTPIGNYSFPKFYQGHGKKARRKALVETYGVPWEAASANVSNGSTVTFRVGLSTRATYESCSDDGGCSYHTYALVQGADIDVDGSGRKVDKQGIRLQSAAAAPQHTCRPVFLGLPVVLYFLVLYV
ncbi:OLC1v1022831C1 [Oldenlandia corymbosa var. corymbosa]|uniref:OLC1v1022831C1 n=1 Tax=Oldenlandia corymbosa var. corymbosa TaxID=529605 RepID=A0AAV1BYP5_OLDCO|nr:OLC1v1022831C1 [Oldenlandia corymbosa var. corymbosa]